MRTWHGWNRNSPPLTEVLTFPDQGVGKLYLAERTAVVGPWQIKKDEAASTWLRPCPSASLGQPAGTLLFPIIRCFCRWSIIWKTSTFFRPSRPARLSLSMDIQCRARPKTFLYQSGAEQIYRVLVAILRHRLPICRYALEVRCAVERPSSLAAQTLCPRSLRIPCPCLHSGKGILHYSESSCRTW